MRDIKFRAWDHQYDLMRTSDFTVDSTGKIFDLSGELLDFVDLMQYTGRKDQHDKPIYEGDVITFGDQGDHAVVEWSESDAQFQVDGFGFDADRCYVIGNIFEHPQLLVS